MKERHEEEILKILSFLHVPVNTQVMSCLKSYDNRTFRRQRKHFNPFRRRHRDIIDEYIERADKLLKSHIGKGLPRVKYMSM